MPGVRRRLRAVTKKVSGVLVGPRDEAAPDDPPVEEAQYDVGTAAAPGAATELDPPETLTPAHDVTAGDLTAGDLTARREPSVTAAAPQADPAASTPDHRQPVPVQPDPAAAAAVDLARAAAVEVAGGVVGEHLGVEGDPDPGEGHVVAHWFATTDPAYVGWRWAVSLARAEGSDDVTVDEVVLLPGADALLAPPWVPWSERVQPGDLGAGDLLPPPADDPRLVPSYADVDAEPLPFDLHRELGLGRPRVLSLDGRADAAERWYAGEAGPDTPVAQAAPGRCADCGFLAPMAGALGRVFGACANAMAPDDGRVVALTHGCGAHSETVVEQPESSYSGMAVELEELELLDADVVVAAPLGASDR